MAANNLRIVYDNIVDYTSSTITVSSTASSATIAANLKSDTRSLIWRSGTHTNFSIPAVFKNVNSAATTGKHSNLLITCTASSGTPTLYYTLTGNGSSETGTTTQLSTLTTSILDTAGRTSYVLKIYSGVTTSTTLLDQQTIPVVMSSAGTTTVLLTNQWHRLPGTTTASAVMTGSGTNIIVYDGTTPLRYDGVGTNPGSFSVSRVGTGITPGAVSSGANNSFAVVAQHSTPVANSSTIVYTITGRTYANNAISTAATQTCVVSGVGDGIYYNTNFETTLSRAVIELENIPTSSPNIGAVALTYTNLSEGATMRILGYNAAVTVAGTVDLPYFYTGATRSFDTGPLICCPFASTREPANNSTAYGTVTYGLDKQLVRGYVPTATQAGCINLIVELIDFQNTDNWIEASKLICGSYWSPTFNTEYGLSAGLQDESETVRTENGNLITTNGVVYKTLNFNLNYLTASDRNQMVKLLRNAGKRRGIFISLFPDNSDDWEQESLYQLYGKLSEGFDISHPYYQYFSTTVQLEEI